MAGEDIIRTSLKDLRRLKVLHGVLEKRFTQKIAASMNCINL